MNNITLIGRLTKDPELKETENGSKFASFTLAVGRGKAKDGQQRADFLPVMAWGSAAEVVVKYNKKGSLLGVNGRLCMSYRQDENGIYNYKYWVRAESIELLDSKSKQEPEAMVASEEGGALPFDV